MPKKARELKPLEVSKIKKIGFHAVGGVPGLYLQIIGNSRSWVLYVVINGRRRKMGLGSCSDVSLMEARDKARDIRKKILDGLDPIEERQKAKSKARLHVAKTKIFRECAEAFIMANRAGWKVKYAQQWENTMAD